MSFLFAIIQSIIEQHNFTYTWGNQVLINNLCSLSCSLWDWSPSSIQVCSDSTILSAAIRGLYFKNFENQALEIIKGARTLGRLLNKVKLGAFSFPLDSAALGLCLYIDFYFYLFSSILYQTLSKMTKQKLKRLSKRKLQLPQKPLTLRKL